MKLTRRLAGSSLLFLSACVVLTAWTSTSCTSTSGISYAGGGPLDAGSAIGDAGTFAWTEVTPCPLARFEANGTVVGGELWVLGGFISRALAYYPSSLVCMVAGYGGKIYFATNGAAINDGLHVYDPATDTWRPGPALPGAQTHFGVVGVGGDIVVVGGFMGNLVSRTADVWRWSAADSTWQPGPALLYSSAPRAGVSSGCRPSSSCWRDRRSADP